jgi:hypothetical protein
MHLHSKHAALFAIILAASPVIAACSSSSSSSTTEASACATLDPIAAASALLTAATKVSFITNDTAGETPTDVTVEISRDNAGNFAATTAGIVFKEANQLVEERIVDGSLFEMYHPDSPNPDGWIAAGPAPADVSLALDTSINEFVTGSSSVAPGVYQLDDTLSSSFTTWQSWPKELGKVGTDCEYEFTQPANAGGVVAMLVDSSQRLTRFHYSNTDVHGTLQISYSPVTIEMPEGARALDKTELNTATLAAITSQLESAATGFDRNLRSFAVQTASSDPRAADAVREALESDGAPASATVTAFTPKGSAVVARDGVLMPSLSLLLAPSVSMIELSKGQASVCIQLSAAANMPATITSTACPR